MNTLYISDLDGTLLNRDAFLDDADREALGRLLDAGLAFTAATARTQATVKYILAGVPLRLPVILMNGVTWYDLARDAFVHTKYPSRQSLELMLDTAVNDVGTGFIYCIRDGRMTVYYENLDAPGAEDFLRERVERYGKRFTHTDDLRGTIDEGALFYSVQGPRALLERAAARLREDPGLHAECYRDIYYPDSWFLEVAAADASKRNAVLEMKTLYGFDRVVTFGDNLNDLPMFEVSDLRVAVSNARPEVRERADLVIDANTDHGVLKFLLEREGQN